MRALVISEVQSPKSKVQSQDPEAIHTRPGGGKKIKEKGREHPFLNNPDFSGRKIVGRKMNRRVAKR
jgi:hypothetical protein